MPRKVTVKYVSLRSSLVNLPIGMYGPLVESRVRPQSLVVHLTSIASTLQSQPVSAYLGWTGMASASSIAQWQSGKRGNDGLETVEIDPQLASSLGFAEGSTVEIGLLHDLPVAKSVSTEPISSDDWEILELHAGYVEDNLLSQVRAASVGQEIDVWVLGRTRARFTVVSFDPPGPAVVLSTNTEVSIAPKARLKPTTTTKALPSSSVRGDNAVKHRPSPLPCPRVILRALPDHYSTDELDASLKDFDSVALVSPVSFQELTGENILLSSQRQLVSIHRLRPPLAPPSKNRIAEPLRTIAPLQPRILHKPASKSIGLDELPSSKSMEVAELRWSKDVPDYHVALSHREDVEDYDLVRVQTLRNEEQEKYLHTVKADETSSNLAPRKSWRVASARVPSQLLAGVDHLLQQCYDFAINSFVIQSQEQDQRTSRIPGLLLCGPSGSGRTSIAKAAMKRLTEDKRVLSYSNYVDLTRYGEESVPTLKALFHYWMDLAKWHRPSVIVLDNLERVVPAEVEHVDSFRSRHLAEHFVSVFGSNCAILGIAIIATCQNQAAIHPLLLSSHMFPAILSLKPPNKDARRDILAGLVGKKLSQSELRVDSEHPLNFVSLATQTEGYLATDLHDLVARALHQAAIRGTKEKSDTILREEDFNSAQVDFTPLSLRDVKLQKSEISWADIGGLWETRRVLRETLEWPTKYAAIFANCPLRLRSGLLLYGYPGCGKTLLASAVARECGLNFISIKGPELLNKYIGASEKSVRDLFERASAAKPCVLFFDEFDSIAPKRGHDSTGVTDRVVNQLLTQMDGAEGLDGVYILAATSRPDLIDPALLRPGRLDKSLLCGMPDRRERKEIIQAIAKKINLATDIDLDYYTEATEGYSGADLQALIYNAHLEAIHSALQSSPQQEIEPDSLDITTLQYISFGGASEQQITSRAEQDVVERRLATILASQSSATEEEKSRTIVSSKREIQDVHLRKSLRSMRPSIPPEERQRLFRIYQAFVTDRSGELPVPPEAGGIGNRASLM